MQHYRYVKNVRIWSFTDPHFPAFGLNMEIYSVNLRIQSECRKMRTRKTPNKDTIHAVLQQIDNGLSVHQVTRNRNLTDLLSSIFGQRLLIRTAHHTFLES